MGEFLVGKGEWGLGPDLGCQVQEGITRERAHGQAQEGLEDIVGDSTAAGAGQKQEAKNGRETDEQCGQRAIQVLCRGGVAGESLPLSFSPSSCFPGPGLWSQQPSKPHPLSFQAPHFPVTLLL